VDTIKNPARSQSQTAFRSVLVTPTRPDANRLRAGSARSDESGATNPRRARDSITRVTLARMFALERTASQRSCSPLNSLSMDIVSERMMKLLKKMNS